MQIERFETNNDSINSLMLGAKVGQVMQAHVPINVSCSSDLTDYISAFLIVLENITTLVMEFGMLKVMIHNIGYLRWRPEYV